MAVLIFSFIFAQIELFDATLAPLPAVPCDGAVCSSELYVPPKKLFFTVTSSSPTSCSI